MFWIFIRIASLMPFSQISKTHALRGNNNKTNPFLYIILLIKVSFQSQINLMATSLGKMPSIIAEDAFFLLKIIDIFLISP